MRAMRLSAGATLLAAAALGSMGTATAEPDVNNPAINGTYLATSNGEWARTNDSFHEEATVQSTWTITSTCPNPTACYGTVVSDQGWTAKIVRVPGKWRVIRELPGWETCGVGPGAYPHPADGTAATGRQVFIFWPTGDNPGMPVDATSNTFSGDDTTTGPSGACGYSAPLEISLPFKLVKIS